MMQYTFSMIKPDATKRDITGAINKRLEENKLRIVGQKMLQLTVTQAEEFYSEHKARPFFADLIKYITSGKVIVQVLKGEDAVVKNREIMGATNPAAANEGTIRKDFGLNIEENSIHGSDSEASAQKEINFFFNQHEILE